MDQRQQALAEQAIRIIDKAERKIWVIVPTVILFQHGSEGNYTDLTFTWICFGISLRFGENKKSPSNI